MNGVRGERVSGLDPAGLAGTVLLGPGVLEPVPGPVPGLPAGRV
jgi:hypothetical protein